jgi:hypothetical protein
MWIWMRLLSSQTLGTGQLSNDYVWNPVTRHGFRNTKSEKKKMFLICGHSKQGWDVTLISLSNLLLSLHTVYTPTCACGDTRYCWVPVLSWRSLDKRSLPPHHPFCGVRDWTQALAHARQCASHIANQENLLIPANGYMVSWLWSQVSGEWVANYSIRTCDNLVSRSNVDR